MKIEAAADLLTWKNTQVEENILLEFTQQYEKLTDEEKSDFTHTAKTAYREYVQEMMKRVREPRKPTIRIECTIPSDSKPNSSESSKVSLFE